MHGESFDEALLESPSQSASLSVSGLALDYVRTIC